MRTCSGSQREASEPVHLLLQAFIFSLPTHLDLDDARGSSRTFRLPLTFLTVHFPNGSSQGIRQSGAALLHTHTHTEFMRRFAGRLCGIQRLSCLHRQMKIVAVLSYNFYENETNPKANKRSDPRSLRRNCTRRNSIAETL